MNTCERHTKREGAQDLSCCLVSSAHSMHGQRAACCTLTIQVNAVHAGGLLHLLNLVEPTELVPAHNVALICPCPPCIKATSISSTLAEIMQIIVFKDAVYPSAIGCWSNHDARMRCIKNFVCRHGNAFGGVASYLAQKVSVPANETCEMCGIRAACSRLSATCEVCIRTSGSMPSSRVRLHAWHK